MTRTRPSRLRAALTLALAALVALPAAAAPPPAVTGKVLDSRGKPLAGAIIWVRPAVTTGLLTVRSNAKGEFRADALPRVPYLTYGYHQVEYGGRLFCLRLAPTSLDQYDSFVPGAAGVRRDFRWQLTGRIMDGSGPHDYFGAEVRLMNGAADDATFVGGDATIEATFTPTGPLIDGSAGKTIVKRAKYMDQFFYDLPVGKYRVKAVGLRPDGSRFPLAVGQDGSTMGPETDFEFRPGSGCGTSGNGVERAFLYVARR